MSQQTTPPTEAPTQKPAKIYRDNEEYKVVKKLPKRFPKRLNDIYITNKTDFNAQLKRCEQLLIENADKNEIYLHAMGVAINRYTLEGLC